jgi:hypothetical protein
VRFVKTAEEARRLQAIYAPPRFMATRSLTVPFEAAPEAVQALLPCAFRKMDFMDVVAEGTLIHSQATRKTREGRGRRRQTE